MLSKFEYDGDLNPNFRVGDFALPLSSIYGVNTAKSSSQKAAKFVHVSSAGVTRVNRSGVDLEKVQMLADIMNTQTSCLPTMSAILSEYCI